MAHKTLDLSKSVFDLTLQYPELIEVLAQIGFADIAKPGMITTAGRIMTIPKGARLKRFDLDEVISSLENHGFSIERQVD